MKKISAILIIAAVLNPLCCCWTYGEAGSAESQQPDPHACCNSESDTNKSSESNHDQANCEHEEVKESAITANATISLPDIPLVPHADLYRESHDMQYLRSSMESFEKSLNAQLSVPRWVGVQTDCVRRM